MGFAPGGGERQTYAGMVRRIVGESDGAELGESKVVEEGGRVQCGAGVPRGSQESVGGRPQSLGNRGQEGQNQNPEGKPAAEQKQESDPWWVSADPWSKGGGPVGKENKNESDDEEEVSYFEWE